MISEIGLELLLYEIVYGFRILEICNRFISV